MNLILAADCGGWLGLAGAKQSAVVRDHEGELAWAVELETNERSFKFDNHGDGPY